MDTMEDIQKIISNYLVRGGNYTQENSPEQAEKCFTEGLAKLKALKLSREDRHNFRLLRNAFECSIDSAKTRQKGRIDKSIKLSDKAIDYASRYRASILARVDKS